MKNIDKKDLFKVLKDTYEKSFYLNIIEHKNKS